MKAARNLLTLRECQVLLLREEGLPLKQIAARLRISINTAKAHLKAILRKLHALSTLEAVYRLRPTRCRTCGRGLRGRLRLAARGYRRP